MEEQEKRELRPDEEEALARFQEELRRMRVDEHIVTMMQSLATLAVRKMGMAPDTGPERDLEQARLAIEAYKALLPLVEPTRPEGEVQIHRGMLAELQMAYVAALRQGDDPLAEGQAPADTLDTPDMPDAPDEEAPAG